MINAQWQDGAGQVPVRRVLNYNIKVQVKPDGSGIDHANTKKSMNLFDEVALEEAVCLKKTGTVSEVVALS